jgi:hypothetical protein
VTRPNRVNPWGQVVESQERGYFMGNRDYGDAWITCSLRHPDGTTGPIPVAYRKLFLLDEATALAAGHRPCGQCRRKGERGVRRRLTECQATCANAGTLTSRPVRRGAGTAQRAATFQALSSPSTERVLDAGYRPWVHPSVWRP